MTHFVSRKPSSVPLEERIIVGRTEWVYDANGRGIKTPLLEIMTVIEQSTAGTVLWNGVDDPELLPPGKLETSKRREVMWTNLLPSGTDEQIIAFCTAVIAGKLANYAQSTLLAHVEGIEEGRLIARPVLSGPAEARYAAKQKDEFDPPASDVEHVGNAAFLDGTLHVRKVEMLRQRNPDGGMGFMGLDFSDRSTPLFRAGDLIASSDYKFKANGEIMTASFMGSTIIGNFTRDEIGAFLPPAQLPDGANDARDFVFSFDDGIGISDGREIEHEFYLGHARAEPDEALFLFYASEEDKPKETDGMILGHRGYLFAAIDNIGDYFWKKNKPEGLWLFSGAEMWSYRSYEGEYDSGIDGDWTPATLEDLERFGYDAASVGREIGGQITVEGGEEEIGLRYLEMAAEGDAAERAEDERLADEREAAVIPSP